MSVRAVRYHAARLPPTASDPNSATIIGLPNDANKAPSRAQAPAHQLRECQHEVLQGSILDIEHVYVEVKSLAHPDRAPVQMRGAEHKRPGRVCKTAGALTLRRLRLEDVYVRARGADIAALRIPAVRYTHQLA